MKSFCLLYLSFFITNIYSQINDSFTDLDFTKNPLWFGDTANFIVNENAELQSNAPDANQSFLLSNSQSVVNAEWEVFVRINYATSSSNYARVYLSVDTIDFTNGFRGYFVQLGGTEDEVSLYLNKGNESIKIIDGIDKSLEGKTSETWIKVKTDSLMNFYLYRKSLTDTAYVLEGQVLNNDFIQGKYFGLGYSNTKSTGKLYVFDNIAVSGERYDMKVFEQMESEKMWISLSSEIFYPDNPEDANSLRMYFDLEEENYVAQIKVFNSSGETVKVLAQDVEINSHTSFVWGGEGNDGSLLNSGIYIVYAKLFNLKSGNIKNFKEAVVLLRF